jgi:tripartite-type tricarboxylate transporter receptor subunit TctC
MGAVIACCVAGAFVVDAWIRSAQAQAYPNKPVRLVLPYTPGGGTDLIARPLAQKLASMLRQQVVIDNRGGANGNIGMEIAAKAPPDGYTLLLGLTAQLAINPAVYAKLPYDPVRDFSPVILLGSAPYLLTVNAMLPAASVAELIALAKVRPGQLAFASSGNGGIPHFAGELLKRMASIDLVHVPYKGGGPAMTDLISGQVQMNFAVIPVGMPYVRAGRLRALAVTSLRRFNAIPEVPSLAETLRGYEISTWYGVMAPARTPARIIEILQQAVTDALRDPELVQNQTANGFEADGGGPQALAAKIRAELVKWSQLVAASGVKFD